MKSPLYEKFCTIKASNPNAIVIFRLGDFYEIFGDDAKVVAELLDITLCTRLRGDERVPLTGFPYRMKTHYFGIILKHYNVVVSDGGKQDIITATSGLDELE